jgi:GPH family glycoside/pentoside/hexuronide:cation symporter
MIAEAAAAEVDRAPEGGHFRLPFAIKLTYSAGQLVELVIGSMLNIFILFYVTAVCGVPGGLAGLALGAGLVIDAFMDPLIGSLSDGWRSRFGRRVPFMVVAVIPLIITFNLIFALPTGWGTTAVFVWLTLLSVWLRIALSLFHLPYQALGAELSDDYAERSSIAAWRWGIGLMGTFAVIGLGYGVFFAGPDGVSNRAGYLPLTLTLTGLVILGAASAIYTGMRTRSMQLERATPTEAIHRRLVGEMAEMFRNRTFVILFGASVLLNVAQGVSQALGLHMVIFFWGLDSAQMPAIGVGAVLGLILGAPLAGPLSKRMEKRAMLAIGMTGLALCQALPVVLRLLGLLPLIDGALTGFLVVTAVLNGAMFTLAAIAFMAVIPDAADEHEQLFGTRREGMYFAGWAFASKASHGAGLLISGIVLQLIAFPSHVTERTAATVIPQQTLDWLGVAGGPGAGLIALAGTMLALLYRVDRKAHARIVAELAARRDRLRESNA